MSRAAALTAFKPSFLSMPIGVLRSRFEAAYTDGLAKIQTALAQGNPTEVEGVLPASASAATEWLQFGHTQPGDGVLSGQVPYRMKATFKANDDVDVITLTLFFLNPRIVLARESFIPASRTGKLFQSAGAETDGCALKLSADPPDFTKIKDGLPAAALVAPAAPWQAYALSTLSSRFDLSLEWTNSSAMEDVFGRIFAVPGGKLPAGFVGHDLNFCNLLTGAVCDAMMHTSQRFAIALEADKKAGGIELILEAPTKPAANAAADVVRRWDLYRLLRQEFGLTGDFKGIVCDGLSAHYLDDDHQGHDNVSLGVGATAFAFSGKTMQTANQSAKWYTTAELTVQGTSAPFLGLEPAGTLSVSIAEGGLRFLSLKGRFAATTQPAMKWLSQKDVVISLAKLTWKDPSGNTQTDWGVELALVGSGDRVIARLTDSDVSPATITGLTTALVFGPLVTNMNPTDADLMLTAPDAKTRGYYIDLADEQALAAIVAGSVFGQIFKNAIHVEELRIVGVYARTQPRQVTKKTAPPGQLDTALLFDYETDYHVDLQSTAGVKTARAVSTRVDGSGFAIGGGLRWVQVPGGIRELSLDDPGLWQLSGLGKLLRIVQVSIRRRNPTELVIRLRLAGNFGIVKADEFVFVLDLTDPGAKLIAYPSEITIDLPSTVKATGKLVIGDSATAPGSKSIQGSLDITIVPISLRLFAGVGIDAVMSPTGQRVSAVIAGAEAILPKPLPLGASGISLSAIEGLYASNFARIESPQVGAVPPALKWLQSAGGSVARSVTDPALWRPEYDRWSFGLGTTLGLTASSRLVNLNSMLVVELPGPTILLFSKLSILKDPKSNVDAAVAGLLGGILGVLKIDVARREITLAALADLDFRKLVRIRGALELFFAISQLSRWHFYLGTATDRITVKLELGDLLDVGADLYFMAAGDQLATPFGVLPGFALALGFHAWAQIGTSDVYLRVDLRADLVVSISKDLFIAGSISMSGELNLYVVSIAASGAASFSFLKTNPEPPNQIFVDGHVCGKVKVLFVTLEGCVSLTLGSPIAPAVQLPDLIDEVALISGSDVAMFGQGIAAPIDGKLGSAKPLGSTSSDPPPTVPIDSVIMIAMNAPPGVSGTSAFAQTIPSAAAVTRFNFGGVDGGYVIKDVRLTKGGQPVLGASTPARWWRNATLTAGGQPSPVELALLTRNPFGTSNTMPQSDGLDAWIDAVAKDPCGKVRGPQQCLYHFAPEDHGPKGTWIRPGKVCSLAIASDIGSSGITDLTVTTALVPKNPPAPVIPGFPLVPAACEAESAGQDPIEVLKLTVMTIAQASNVSATFSTGGFSNRTNIQLIAAVPAWYGDPNIPRMFTIRRFSGPEQPIQGTVHNLLQPQVQTGFHNGCTSWKQVIDAFVALATLPRFSAYRFVRIDIDLTNFDATAPARELVLNLRPQDNQQSGNRQSVLIAAFKCTPLAEETRARDQQQEKSDVIAEITDFITNAEVPLLERTSTYEVAVDYDKSAQSTVPATQTFTFQTAPDPPRKLDPYALATFPIGGERFHYTSDRPGVVLSTNLILRVLVKYAARLRITISDDLGRPVTDSTGQVTWETTGIDIDPATLLDLTQPTPLGIDRMPVAGVHSATLQALADKIARGELACLGNPKFPDTALWIGFDVMLTPLTGYLIRMDVIDASGQIWPWPPSTEGLDSSTTFFQWRFATSLYASTAAHASVLQRAGVRHRLVSGSLAMPPGSVDPAIAGLELVNDKLFEDAIAAAIGERSHRGGDPQITVLWTQQGNHFTPAAVVAEANEPLVRRTTLPAKVAVPGAPGALNLTEGAPFVFSSPVVASAGGVTRAVSTTSGFAMLLELGTAAVTNGVTMSLGDTALEWIPRALVPAAPAVVIPAAVLTR